LSIVSRYFLGGKQLAKHPDFNIYKTGEKNRLNSLGRFIREAKL
jgi:hypothetical protein